MYRNTSSHPPNPLPDSPLSYWIDSTPVSSYPSLKEDITTDAAVIGGGITGILTAYLLAQEGMKVVLLESRSLFHGTTGHTTAKLTVQHGLIYSSLIDYFGEDKARLYYEANRDAMLWARKAIEEHQLPCDLSEEDTYVYTQSEKELEKLEKEMKAYERLGILGKLTDTTPLPLTVKSALMMRNQAQFHPLHFLRHFLDQFTKGGGQVYEQTRAVKIEYGEEPVVLTGEGHKVRAKHVIQCSHFPVFDEKGLYFARLYAERSYVIAAKTKEPYPGGMYINAESPTRSLRSAHINGENMVLFIGENHKTGQDILTLKRYEALETFGRETFGIQDIPYRWSAQDLVTLDKVPYIGQMTSDKPNLWVATGFRKWGMTNGIAAALLLKDRIMEKSPPYGEVVDPSRFKANPSVKNLVVQNADVAKQLVTGKFDTEGSEPEELGLDEGTVCTVDGKRAGAYKDRQGDLHIVDTTCTHMGCELHWNQGERSWDCPCHGSRFNVDGEVLEGPAVEPLKKLAMPHN